MKKMIKIALSLFLGLGMCTQLNAQSLDEAIKMYKYNRFETAQKMLEPMAASNPIANYYLGLCALAEDNIEKAKAIFQKYPDDAANNAGIARVLLLENKTPEAMSMLTKVASKAKKKDWKPFQYAADAITYTEGGDPNVAIDWYNKALQVDRKGELLISLGDAYRKIQGGGGNAMNNYEFAEADPQTQSLANYKMGNLWYGAKNYDSALAKYNRSSQQDPQNPLPFKDLANAYYRVGKYKISKENIEKYLELSDKTVDDQIQYANTLYLSKEYPAAITKMQQLIASGEERPYMYRIIGFSQYETKDYENAKKNMDLFFAKQDPKKTIPMDYLYYAKILMTEDANTEKANEFFKKGVEMDTAKDKTGTMREIAEAYKDANKYLPAAEWYKKITETNSENVEPLDYWWSGVMYFYGKEYALAEPMLKAMSEKYPQEPSSYYWLARVTVAGKDKDYKNGIATESFNKWLGMINQEDPAKKNDLIKAYTYMAMVAYNNNNKENAKLYCDKLLKLDPQESTATQILKALESMK